MNELSQQVAALMHTPAIVGLETERHIDFVMAVSGAQTMGELPKWAQKIIARAELQAADETDESAPSDSGAGVAAWAMSVMH